MSYEDEAGASRRDVLRGGALGMGALVGAIGVAGSGAAEASAPGFHMAARATTAQTFWLQVAGIDGPSTTKGFEKQIPVHSWSLGAANTATPVGTGGGSGKVVPEPFVVTMGVSKASPRLFLACCTGKHIANAVLIGLRKNPKGHNVKYLRVTLTDILVSSLHDGESSGGVPLDTVHFTYQKVEWLVDGEKVTFDFKANTT
jgi:type VI secretion system secreted protein Hcp